ncbi:hypothetical protein, partial [Streptomyces sp. CC216C]
MAPEALYGPEAWAFLHDQLDEVFSRVDASQVAQLLAARQVQGRERGHVRQAAQVAYGRPPQVEMGQASQPRELGGASEGPATPQVELFEQGKRGRESIHGRDPRDTQIEMAQTAEGEQRLDVADRTATVQAQKPYLNRSWNVWIERSSWSGDLPAV